MVTKSIPWYREWLRRVQPFWALSRIPHVLLDMAAPVLGALLALGGFPSLGVMFLGIITAFAGYTSVYALNDVIDYQVDMEKVNAGGYDDSEAYLDGIMIRHPMAKGMISLPQGVLWVVLWSISALIGAYLLNPVCVWIFLGGIGLEIVYCRLWKVTPFRSIVNGAVKTCGPVAAVFAVNSDPSLLLIIILFLWIFSWEIGGQNIPADWTDIEEDRQFQGQTIPVKLGIERAGIIALLFLISTLPLNVFLLFVSPLTLKPYLWIAIVACNLYFLLVPAQSLYKTKHRRQAMALFNKASYYPVAILGVVLIYFISGPP